uniref:Uncharacterized protein n=1 Tax=Ixodes ricinus TaxID=34613 RepID=A0A6B0UED2_IXORI
MTLKSVCVIQWAFVLVVLVSALIAWLSSVSSSVDQEGRLISCNLSLRHSKWRFICVYAHNTVNARSLFFQFLAKFMDTEKEVLLFVWVVIAALNFSII